MHESLHSHLPDSVTQRFLSRIQQACSMPVTIPPRFSAFGDESRTKKVRRMLVHASPHAHSLHQGGASMEDEDVYGKSFQVPDKRSRQMV